MVLHGKEISNIFKTSNVTNLTKAILKGSYRFLQVTSKWKTRKTSVYFLRAAEFWPTLDIQISINFSYTLGKVAKLHFLESSLKSHKTRQYSC